MKRKMVGMSEGIHDDLQSISNDVGIPMTAVLEALLSQHENVQWQEVKKSYDVRKPTWQNIKRLVKEYRGKYPNATDQKLSELTGFSIRQIETVTHTAHKRCIGYMQEHPKAKPKRIAQECDVSEAFARRVYSHYTGEQECPKSERYLYK